MHWKGCVINPRRQIVGEVAEEGSVTTMEINLDEKIYYPYFGHFKSLYPWDRRYETYGALSSSPDKWD